MVSVIIPNYNHAPFLKERIESVLNQNYNDFEVILLDDKSTDNSVDILKSYENHPKVSCVEINKDNSGSTFKQWLKGISIAKGEYIWIAESDDVAHPDFLQKIVPAMEKDKGIVLGFSGLDMVDSDGNLMSHLPLKSYMRHNVAEGHSFIRHNLVFGCHILNASSAVFRKDAAMAVPKDFMQFRSAGDYLFWIELARLGKVYKTPEALDYFRQHNLKVTPGAVASGLMFEEVFRIYKRLIEYGFIKGASRYTSVGFWLFRLEKEKNNIASVNKYFQLRKMWRREIPFSAISPYIYLCNGVFRRLNKKVLGCEI